LFLSFWCDQYGKDALPIYRQASLPLSCKRQQQGKWHRIGAYFVDLAAPIGAASGTELVPILLT
jgi:hypothetical protein